MGVIVHSRRIVGAIAVGAIVVAAISFAIVDASIAAANGCMGTSAPCEENSVPVVAISFSALGILALLVSILPAISWIVESVRMHQVHPQGDLELARSHRPKRSHGLDDFDAM